MWPRHCLTIPYTVASPRPVPFPLGFVVKNGSKARVRTSSLIPLPVSLTTRRAYLPGGTAGCASRTLPAAPTRTARASIDLGFKATVVASTTATRDLPDALTGGIVPAAEVQRNALAAIADRFATVAKDVDALPD